MGLAVEVAEVLGVTVGNLPSGLVLSDDEHPGVSDSCVPLRLLHVLILESQLSIRLDFNPHTIWHWGSVWHTHIGKVPPLWPCSNPSEEGCHLSLYTLPCSIRHPSPQDQGSGSQQAQTPLQAAQEC